MNRNALVILALVAVAVAVAPRPAQAGPFGLGPRVGFSTGPDQFIVGIGLVRPLGSRLELAPSLDFGFADNGNSISLNGDVRYTIGSASRLKPYVGAGLTYTTFNPDADNVDTSNELGANLLGGIWLNKDRWPEFNLEARLGLGDVPDFEVMLGFSLF
jgi:hypothetical protein